MAATVSHGSAGAGDAGSVEVLATFQINEPLSRDWSPEWVTFRADLKSGAAAPGDLWVTTPDASPVEHAIRVESTHPDGSAESVIASVFTGLGADETKTFLLVRAPALAAERPAPVSIKDDGQDHAILVSDRLEVMVPAANVLFEEPAAPEDVPPPILGIRRPGGSWVAPSRITGTAPVRSVRTEVLPRPAHIAACRVVYDLAGGGTYEVVLELPSHDPVLLVEEDFMDCATGALVLDLRTGHEPTTGHWRLHRPSPKKRNPRGREHHYPLDFSEPSTLTLQPFFSWYEDQAVWWGSYSKWGPGYLCLFATQPTKWINPLVNLPRIVTEPGPVLEARLPLRAGKRRWGIIFCAKEESSVENPDADPVVYGIMIRHGENPLDKVKDMVFDWPGCEKTKYPRLLCSRDDVPAIREKARSHPLFNRILEQHPDDPRDPAGLYLATGSEAAASEALEELLSFLRMKIDDLFSNGYTSGSNVCIGHSRPVRDHAFVYDLIADSPVMTEEDRRYCRHALTFLASVMTDQDYWPTKEQGIPRGNINFHSDWYTCVVVAAGLLPGHPDYDRWLRWGESEMDLEFDRNVFPGGAWMEAPNYHMFTMHYLLLAAVVLQRAGFKDFSKDPRVRATMHYAMETQTPVDPRAHHAMLPTMGDTTSWYHSQSLQVNFAWMASLAKDDPRFAGNMMYAWERAGRMIVGVHNLGPGSGWTYPLCLIDPTIPPVPPEPPLRSRAFPGFGAVLRNNAGTKRESMFLFKMGKAAHHYDNDEGTFHWYARGIPLCLDFGNMYSPSVDQPWLHNTLAFNERKVWSTGNITKMNSLGGLDYTVGQITVQHVQATSRLPDEPGPGEPILYGHEWVLWRRQVLFVKGPDYIVLRDDLEDAKGRVPTEWSLQVLADEAKVGPGRATFTGQLGMDLDVVFAEPAAAMLDTDEWSHPGKEQPDWFTDFPLSAMGERQISLHARAQSGGDYLAALYPYRHEEEPPRMEPVSKGLLRIGYPGAEDLVFFSNGWEAVESDGARFSGRVGIVRREAGKRTVWVLEGDGAEFEDFYFTCPGPIRLEIGERSLEGDSDGPARTLSGKWAEYPGIPVLTVDGERVEVDSTPDGFFFFTIPEGPHQFRVRYEKDVNVWEF